MKTLDYYLNEKKSSELINNSFEILDNEKLCKIKGGIADPSLG